MVTILLQKILDLLKENLSNMIKFFVTDPQEGQTLVYDAEAEEWKNDYVEIELQETASGSVATFDTEAHLPLVSLKANITATQSGTGTPSPSNPRPISGFSSVTLTQKDSEDTTVDTFTISLGDTYYGGVLDVKNGTATITHERVDLGSLDWIKQESTITGANMYAASVSGRKYGVDSSGIVGISDSYSFYRNATISNLSGNLPNYQFGYQTTNNRVWVRDDRYSSIEDFSEGVTGVYLVFELDTPITITGLTPDNFTTIAGENNIFADCGDVEVIYNTSSAQKVWDLSNYVKDLSSDLTINTECIEESSADVRAYQQGHLVYVQIQNLKYAFMPEETAVIVTGLPKPVAATYACVGDGYDLERVIRFRVNTDGELQQWYCRPAGNHVAVGGFVYITDEV